MPEPGMDSLRSYFPIACAVTRLPILAAKARRDRPVAERASLSICPIMFYPFHLEFTKMYSKVKFVNLRPRLIPSPLEGEGEGEGCLYRTRLGRLSKEVWS